MSQSFNFDSIGATINALVMDKSLIIPQLRVKSINDLSPQKMVDSGIKAVLVDKDNTVTKPYQLEIYQPFIERVNQFKDIFKDRFKILSNSAGSSDDIEYRDALRIEESLGIDVIRHRHKKPLGGEEILADMGVKASECVVIGDRLFTDILFGNRYGIYSVLTDIITLDGDNPTASKVRAWELKLLDRLIRRGAVAKEHHLSHLDFTV